MCDVSTAQDITAQPSSLVEVCNLDVCSSWSPGCLPLEDNCVLCFGMTPQVFMF